MIYIVFLQHPDLKKKNPKIDLPTLPIFRPKGQTNLYFFRPDNSSQLSVMNASLTLFFDVSKLARENEWQFSKDQFALSSTKRQFAIYNAKGQHKLQYKKSIENRSGVMTNQAQKHSIVFFFHLCCHHAKV